MGTMIRKEEKSRALLYGLTSSPLASIPQSLALLKDWKDLCYEVQVALLLHHVSGTPRSANCPAHKPIPQVKEVHDKSLVSSVLSFLHLVSIADL